MLIKNYQQIFGHQPKSILHVGANEGQEVDIYAKNGCNAVYVEAIPDIFEKLQDKCSSYKNQKAILGCCSDTKGKKLLFNVASNGGKSSSMFDLANLSEEYPTIKYTASIELTTTTIDDLLHENIPQTTFDFLIMDIQGAELQALQGAHQFLSQPSLRALGIEVAHLDMYVGGTRFNDLLILLEKYDFFLKDVKFNNAGWGDAIFIKKWWGKNTPLVQDMLCNYEEFKGNQIKNIILSSSQFKHNTADKMIKSLSLEQTEIAFKTKQEMTPYAIFEFKELISYEGAIAIFNHKRPKLSHQLSSIKIEYSSNGTNWKRMQNIEFRTEFLKGLCPMLCSSEEKFQFVRISLNEENSLHLTKLSFLKKKRRQILIPHLWV